jgi:Arc/MetJ-type ribon-helix-helix transcriptional regulator
MDVSIPDSLTGFIRSRVRSGGYPDADAFIADLVRSEAAVMEGVGRGEPIAVDDHFDRRLEALLDEAAAIRGRRARLEFLVTGFVDFLVQNRHYAVMAATDPAARRDKLDDESATLRQRGLTLLFGDNPTGAQRIAGGATFFIPECLPDLVDLTDEELREALQTMLLHMLRVPSGPRE